MRRPWRAAFALGSLVAVTIVALVVAEDRGPCIKGKTLDEWCTIYMRDSEGPVQSTHTPECLEAIVAVRSIREEAVRWALKYVRYEKPNWKISAQSILERLNIRTWGPRAIWRHIYSNPADRVVVCFQMLGPAGSPAIPELVQLIKQSESPLVTARAIDALSYIGDEALPPFIEMIAAKQSPNRRSAILAIGTVNRCQPGVAKPVIPLLIRCLRDPDVQVASAAITVLGDLRLEPDDSVPALGQCLASDNPYLRACAAESLQKFGVEAQLALMGLVRALRDQDYQVRWAATNSLLQVAPEVLKGLPDPLEQ